MREVLLAYVDNLKLVMEYVNQLVNKLTGKVILTADHGDQTGEYMLFGHAPNYRTRQLVIVPWYIAKNTKRKILDKELFVDQNKEELEKKVIHSRIQHLIKEKEF